MVEQPEISKLNVDAYKNKFVHSIDGDLLGTLHSIENDNLIVKKEVIDSIYYHIPINNLKRYDDHGLWLNLTQKQLAKNHLDIKNKNKINIETTTFRLNQSIMNNIRFEAENRMIGLNDLINQIFKRFVEWNQFEPISGMVHIPKPVVTELLNKKSNQEITKMAESIGKTAVYSTVLLMRGKIDSKTFLLWL